VRERMTRLEENQNVIYNMTKEIKSNPSRTYQETVAFQLVTIATMLADISKSLAILAHKAESGDEE
jgi:hypothetical protein